MRILLALLLLAVTAFADVSRLYLKDGSFHLVREWKREGDRVKFYSTERSEWEEVPADLVDFSRTATEISAKKASLAEEEKIVVEEQHAIHEQKQEMRKIPQDPGLYTLENNQLRVFPQADTKVHTNKGRRILQLAVPVPVVLGKSTVELEMEHSPNVVTDDRQEFYFQLAKEEQFAMIRLTPAKGVRIAERLTTETVTKQVDEAVDEVPTFKKQVDAGGLYKIWPEKHLEPGEYAVIEFTPGNVQPQIWDFRIKY